jgi:hypothetical protein
VVLELIGDFAQLVYGQESQSALDYGGMAYPPAAQTRREAMPFTRDQAYQALASLNPAPVFLQAYRSEELPEGAELYFGPPEEYFDAVDATASKAKSSPSAHERRIPILDDGNFGMVTFLDLDTRELVQIDMDAPDEPSMVFKHWQQYLADVLLQVADAEDDDRVRRIAELIGFQHTDKLLLFLEDAESMDSDTWWDARTRFTLSLS